MQDFETVEQCAQFAWFQQKLTPHGPDALALVNQGKSGRQQSANGQARPDGTKQASVQKVRNTDQIPTLWFHCKSTSFKVRQHRVDARIPRPYQCKSCLRPVDRGDQPSTLGHQYGVASRSAGNVERLSSFTRRQQAGDEVERRITRVLALPVAFVPMGRAHCYQGSPPAAVR